MKTKLINDLVYLLVTEKAKEIFSSGTFTLYYIGGNDAVSEITSMHDINICNEHGYDIAIEVDLLSNIYSQFFKNLINNGKLV